MLDGNFFVRNLSTRMGAAQSEEYVRGEQDMYSTYHVPNELRQKYFCFKYAILRNLESLIIMLQSIM